jgi:hypothetical protein
MKGRTRRDDAPLGAGVDLAQLATCVAPLVAVELARMLLGAVEPTTYTTRRDGPRPTEYSDRARAWRELVPTIPGAVRLGRWWSISRTVFEAWRDRQGTPALTPLAAGTAASPSTWSPATIAADLGLRLVGGRSR